MGSTVGLNKHAKCECGHSAKNHVSDGDDGTICKCGCTRFVYRG